MRDRVVEILRGEEAWIVGGAIRDELLGRALVDLDVACRDPERAARAYGGGAPFPLSDRWGAWRVALDDGRTVDFTLLAGAIEDDLASRDFTINAIAEPVDGGERVDPFGGRADLEARAIRAVSPSVFDDDPLRLLRAVRLEDELGFRIEPETERLMRDRSGVVTEPAGERILGELERLSTEGYRRLDELGLLAPLGGRADERLDRADSPRLRLVAALGADLERLPISNNLRRYARTLLAAKPPEDGSPRAIHRFRRATEPWALDALTYLGAGEHAEAAQLARENEPEEPLVRGDELGLAPGPAIGTILREIEEERAAGTISTREEALALAERRARELA